jgi:hypothetical protein
MKSLRYLPMSRHLPIKPQKRHPMSICIAAICEHSTIVMASDKMLTHDLNQIEFEPAPTSIGNELSVKVTPLNRPQSIAMMMAGSQSLQTEIAIEIMKQIRFEEESAGKDWGVSEVADLYIKIYNKIRAQIAESAVLSSFGLTTAEFLAQQCTMMESFVDKLQWEMLNFQMPGMQTIIAGIDPSMGPQIYRLDSNASMCCTSFGYACIGTGSPHAESLFMLNNYCPIVPQQEALWLVYAAKRKAEVAPGVGKSTELFSITRKRGFVNVRAHLDISSLNAIYSDYENRLSEAFKTAQSKTQSFLEDTAKKLRG